VCNPKTNSEPSVGKTAQAEMDRAPRFRAWDEVRTGEIVRKFESPSVYTLGDSNLYLI